MIWAIIRGRTVVFNADISIKGLAVRTDKAVIINNRFDGIGLKDKDNIPVVG